jgi:hypothetical protein
MKRPALPEPDGVILRDDGKEFPGVIQYSDNMMFVEAWNIDTTEKYYLIDAIPVDKVASIRRVQKIKRRFGKS